MDQQIINTFIGQGPWALLFCWLLFNGMKDVRERETLQRAHLKETVTELRELKEDLRTFFRVVDLLMGHELKKRGISLTDEQKEAKSYERDNNGL